MKYFIDTDIGDDIDDALAIGYAIAKGLEIVGITTVYRETAARVAAVKRLTAFSDYEIPVYGGYGKPIDKKVRVSGEMNYGAPSSLGCEQNPETAIEFMANCAERYGKELCIIEIGAQTNLATAWNKYPEKMKKAGLAVIMGGSFTAQRNEWNISEDPAAARIVGESEMNLLYVPFDVTEKTGVGVRNYDIMLNYRDDGLAGCVSDMVRERERRNITFVPILHDPTAVVCALNKTVCKTKEISFCVIDDGPACGITLNADNMDLTFLPDFKKKKITVVTDVNAEDIINEFMQTLYGKQR